MRSHTQKRHDESDKLVNLQLGLILTSRALYGESIALFGAIYERLEVILERNKAHSKLGKFYSLLPVIGRVNGFRKDVAFYLDCEFECFALDAKKGALSSLPKQSVINFFNESKPLPDALSEYLDRLEDLEKNDPIRLLAYVYHMYMAIFAGGFVIKKIVKKAMRLNSRTEDAEEDGVQAFCVKSAGETGSEAKSQKQVKQEIQRIMNDDIAPLLTEDDINRLLEESNEVFRRNNIVVASVKNTKTFERVLTKCKRFIVFPAVSIICAIVLYYFS